MQLRRVLVLLFVAVAAIGTAAPEAAAPLPPLDHLIIATHPDDETIGCAGVMLQAIARQERVGIVVLTHGDAHVRLTAVAAGKPEAQLSPEDFKAAGILRQHHTLRAAASLGVPAEEVVFLGYPDSGLARMFQAADATPWQQPFTLMRETYPGARRDYHSAVHGRPAPYTRASLLRDLAEIVKTRRPKAVYVTHENDRHPDHQAAFRFTRAALQSAGSSARLLAFIVHGVPPAQPPDLRVSLSPAQLAAKRAALLLHQAGVSPVHDYLAPQFAKAEEHFWQSVAP